MKCHIGIAANDDLVHTVFGAAVNVDDVTRAHALVHGEEAGVVAEAGSQSLKKLDAFNALTNVPMMISAALLGIPAAFGNNNLGWVLAQRARGAK